MEVLEGSVAQRNPVAQRNLSATELESSRKWPPPPCTWLYRSNTCTMNLAGSSPTTVSFRASE